MSDILCVTSRRLCKEDFLTRIEKIAAARPKGIILREKDLSRQEYTSLAQKVFDVCRPYQVPCILHSFVKTALWLHAKAIHLPLPLLKTLTEEEKQRFDVIGVSCHCVKEAKKASQLGCSYLTVGHIFNTDCKKGISGKGVSFLKEIVRESNLPVYAIGGICEQNINQIRATGAAGACVMSLLMQCADVSGCLRNLEKPEESHGIS